MWGSSSPPLGTEPIQNEAKRLPVYIEAPDLDTPKNLVSTPRSKMYISSVLVCTAVMGGRRTKRLEVHSRDSSVKNLRKSAFKFFELHVCHLYHTPPCYDCQCTGIKNQIEARYSNYTCIEI